MFGNIRVVKDRLRWECILVVIVVVLGLAVRLHEIRYNLDGDEIFSVELASRNFAQVISGSLKGTPHPPFHNVLLHLWIQVFGNSEISVRALSVLLSIFFLLMYYMLLRRLIPLWLALGVLLIVALSPLFVYYGQQARPYSLIAFLSVGSLLAFIKALEPPRKHWRFVIWAVSCAFLIYTQYLAALLIAFQIGFALFYCRPKKDRLKILAYGSSGSALILPWLIAAMGRTVLVGTDPLPQLSWMESPTTINYLWFYISIFGELPGGTDPLVNCYANSLLSSLFTAASSFERATCRSFTHISHRFGLPTLVFFVSVCGPKNVFAPRQLLGPAFCFVAAFGLCLATMPRNLAAMILVAMVVWTALGLPGAFPHNTKPPWHDLAEQIDTRFGSIIVVAQEEWVRQPLAYYRRGGLSGYVMNLKRTKGLRSFYSCAAPIGAPLLSLKQINITSPSPYWKHINGGAQGGYRV